MSDGSGFSLRRRKDPPLPAVRPPEDDEHDDPEVKAVLSQINWNKSQLRETRAQLSELRRENELLKGKLGLTEQELASARRQRDISNKGFSAQKIHFAVAVSNALACKDNCLATIEAVYQQTKADIEACHVQAIAAIRTHVEPFVEAAHSAMAAIQLEMADAGLDNYEGPSADPVISTETIKKVAASFGADARKPELPEYLNHMERKGEH